MKRRIPRPPDPAIKEIHTFIKEAIQEHTVILLSRQYQVQDRVSRLKGAGSLLGAVGVCLHLQEPCES